MKKDLWRALTRFVRFTIVVAFVVALVCGLPLRAYAGSGTWILDPVNNDWNTAANWSSNSVPNGALDVATFGVSNQTEVSISAQTTVVAIIFSSGASAYEITCPAGQFFFFGDTGIQNESGVVQSFAATVDEAGNRGLITFDGDGSAGSSTMFTAEAATLSSAEPGEVIFVTAASAGSATLISNGAIANGATGGLTKFANTAKAGTATITNKAGLASGAFGGTTAFIFSSSGDNSIITSEGATVSGAAGGLTTFQNDSHAANATLIANGGSNGGAGGSIELTGDATGGAAQVMVFGNGNLNISAHGATPVTIGSLEGNGLVFLGARKLSVGSNNLSKTFSGVMQNTGSLTKVGTGTLTLSGANMYTGGTTVSAGSLQVSNKSGSATGSGAVQVNAGTLSGKGVISGAVTIGTGSGAGAFLAPGAGASKTITLTIQSALTIKADGTYTYRVKTKRAQADKVIANGVTIESGAQFSFK